MDSLPLSAGTHVSEYSYVFIALSSCLFDKCATVTSFKLAGSIITYFKINVPITFPKVLDDFV
jgi:hypothetical protein